MRMEFNYVTMACSSSANNEQARACMRITRCCFCWIDLEKLSALNFWLLEEQFHVRSKLLVQARTYSRRRS
jgi:hypothetical protein